MSRIVLQLALAADVDPRTAAKALAKGAKSVRGRPGERLAEKARELGIPLPDQQSDPPPRAA